MQLKFKHINIISFLLVIPFLLFACASPKPPSNYEANKAQISLAEASFSVSRSMVELAATAQAAHPPPKLEAPPSPASYGMGGLATIDWSGPVEPLVKQIAMATHYRLVILGTQPAIPIIVTIYTKNTMIGEILRDVGYQCGRRATITVYADGRVIELSYAKN